MHDAREAANTIRIPMGKEWLTMQLQAIAKGVAVGAAAGMVGYLVSAAGASEKSKLKPRAVKAVHSIGAVMDSVTDLFR